MNAAHFIETIGIKSDENRVEQLQKVMYRYCLSITGSPWDAEDLVQDTWLKAIGTTKLLAHNNPEAFLLRIAKNTWIDQSRRKSVINRILERVRLKEITTSTEINPFEVEKIFQAIMKHQSPLQRAVFLLRDVFGYSIKETGEVLEMTEGAVKAAHHRARHSLGAIKQEIMDDKQPAPQTEALKSVLQAFIASYLSGDVVQVVRLALGDQIPPDIAIGLAQNQRMANSRSKRYVEHHSNVRMAA